MPEDNRTRNRRQYEWQKESRDRLNLLLPKGRKAEIQGLAGEAGQTVSEWVNEAIDQKIGRRTSPNSKTPGRATAQHK